MPCRTLAIPMPCRVNSHMLCSFVKVRVVTGNNRTAAPTIKRIGMLLITTFVELRVVAGRSRKWARRPHAVSGRPMLIHTRYAMPMQRCAVALRSRFQNSMVVAWHGRGMACVNQKPPHCVNQMGKTQSKPLALR
jgi:hypothetical protein